MSARPSAWTPPSGGVPEADLPPAAEPGAPPPPPPPGFTPPWATTGPGFSRDELVRPRQGRYVAGVCGALARATNTDPVLWRVLLAVLGILSGVGVLLYLIGWLIIPAEGDSASPIESLLGKGRSGMSPLAVVLLGTAAVLSFGFIVQDGMRAALLAAAVILGAVLLIKRTGSYAATAGRATSFPSAAGHPAAAPSAPAAEFPTGAFGTAAFGTADFATAGFVAAPAAPGAAAEPVTEPLAPTPPPAAPFQPDPYATAPAGFAPPPSGYRAPFAPHGPFARQKTPPPAPVSRPPRPPKPPRERSRLGRLTFFAVVVVVGLMAVIDMAGASIAVSAYFAAALVTIALGLVVGTWFGRARGLIALAILAMAGLFVSTGAERWAGDVGASVYRPASLSAVADRYDFTVGNTTLDLRGIDFAGQQQPVTVTMRWGQLRVLLPETVDTTVKFRLEDGRVVLFGKTMDGHDTDGDSLTDLGTDGTGGGTLQLDLQMDKGNLEVIR